MKQNKFLVILAFIFFLPYSLYAADRIAPKKPNVTKCTIKFNKDHLKGKVLVIDTRTEDEKKIDSKAGHLAGDALIFFQGHNQQTTDCYNMTTSLAVNSKSGIIVIPIVDTPYGKDKTLRGDNGKDIILMAMARQALAKMDIKISDYQPITEKEIKINGEIIPQKYETKIKTKVTGIGWSHGGILVRRFAHAYPNSVNSIVQFCPAGFESFGKDRSWCALINLATNFGCQSVVIGGEIFRGKLVPVLDCAAGLTKGQILDNCRTLPSCMFGNFHVGKMFRNATDAFDCTIKMRDTNFEVNQLQNIVTIFGNKDTVIEYKNAAQAKKKNLIPVEYNQKKKPVVWKLPANIEEQFWATYFPANVEAKTKTTLRVVYGTHSGPATDTNLWVKTALTNVNQQKNASFVTTKEIKTDSKAAYLAKKKAAKKK